jgi:hypothetical protein
VQKVARRVAQRAAERVAQRVACRVAQRVVLTVHIERNWLRMLLEFSLSDVNVSERMNSVLRRRMF